MAERSTAAAPELEVAVDLARRALPVAPFLIGLGFLFWGVDGALSSAYGLVLAVLNLLASAALIAWAARISPAVLMGATLGGFLGRFGLLLAAVTLVRDAAWVELVPLLFTILLTHLGLIIWETRYVSLSLAHPGLKPKAAR